MSETWVTADYHLNHPKSLEWRPQFSGLEEMNEAIIDSHNAVVADTDTVYFMGDMVMGCAKEAPLLASRLNGKKHFIIGNHDTPAKLKAYTELGLFEQIVYSTEVKLGKRRFYLSHYPVHVENHTENPVWVLHGHTHATEPFGDIAQNMHVGYETFNGVIALEAVRSLILEN